MTRAFAAVGSVLMLATMLARFGLVSAQDATPAAGGDSLGVGGPAVGTAVPQVDAEGGEQGLITVTEVLDPFDDYDPAYPPEEGTRFVLATLAFENTGQEPFEVESGNLLLQDAAGFVYGPADVERLDAVVPELQSGAIAPGNRVSGVVGFQVPLAAEPATLLYLPDNLTRLISLADLQPEAGPGPAPGAAVTYRDAAGEEIGQVTVTEVLDPFQDYDPAYPPEEGRRYVALTVTFENTGHQAFEATPYALILQDADGFYWGPEGLSLPPESTVTELEGERALAPGDKVSGMVGFSVPADARLTAVLYEPEAYVQDAVYYPGTVRLLRLVDLTAAPPAPVATATVPPTATPAPALPTPTPAPGTLQVIGAAGTASQGTTALAQGAAVELILDTSGSMLQSLGDGLRIDVAKQVLTEVVTTTLPPGTPLALRVFGSEPDSCETTLALPFQPLDPAAVAGQIASIEAVNLVKTPIGAALEQVGNDLADAGEPRIVILVSDGEETCGGDPAAAIQTLRDQGVDVRVTIVGFAIDDDALKQQFEEWARLGGGQYFDATGAAELGEALVRALQPPFQVLDPTDTVVASGIVGGDPVSVPAGTYRLEVRSDPPQVVDEVIVAAGENAQVTLEK